MVNVLVDDKQAPTTITSKMWRFTVMVYLNGQTIKCDDMYPPYPGNERIQKVIHGYYGGNNQYDVYGHRDHNDPQACDQNRGWAPSIVRTGYTWIHLIGRKKSTLSDYFENRYW